jgi:hypothetical protein
VAIGLGLSVLPARAAYVLTLKEVDGDVVATGSGSLNVDHLTFRGDLLSGLIPKAPLADSWGIPESAAG